jgi:Na+/phosphate symporter
VFKGQAPQEGVEMFNALMEKNASQFQLRVLQNRINKLEQEELRAKSKIENAQQRVRELENVKAHKQHERILSDYRASQKMRDIISQNKAITEEKNNHKAIVMQVNLFNTPILQF